MGRKIKRKIVNKDAAGISVPYSTSSTSNAPNTIYTASSQSNTPPASVMYWPNPETWQTQGKDAAKKAYYEYLNALNEYMQTTTDNVEKKLQAAGKMNSLIQSMIQGVQVATEAVENINKRIRQGESTAKIDLDTVVDLVKKMLKTIWVHNSAARQGKHAGLEIKALDSQLIGRINRATRLAADDFGLPVLSAEEADLIWADTTYPPMIPKPVEQPVAQGQAEAQGPEQVQAASEEAQASPDQAALQNTSQEAPPSAMQQPASEPQEIPDELLTQYASGQSVPEGSAVAPEVPQQQPEEEGAEQQPEEEAEEAQTEQQPEGLSSLSEEPEETKEEVEEAKEAQEEAQEEGEEAEEAEDKAEEETEEAQEAQGKAQEEGEEAEKAEDKAEEETEEAEEKLEENKPESTEEFPEDNEGEEGEGEEEEERPDTKFCIECGKDVTESDISECTNPKCPFANEKTAEEPQEEVSQKHYALFSCKDHSDCNVQHFTVKDYSGVEGAYCLDCQELVEYSFDQDEWDSNGVKSWVLKQFKIKNSVKTDKEIAEEVVEEELPDSVLEEWLGTPKEEDELEIEEKELDSLLTNISQVMEESFSQIDERLRNLEA